MSVLRAVGLLLLVSGLILSGPVPYAQDGGDVPEVVRELLDAADRAQQRGRSDEAAANYRRAIELAPGVIRAYTALGALYHQLGERQKALETFQQGLEQAPTEQALLTNAAAVALELGQSEAALELAARAVTTDPRNPDLRYLHGTVLRRLGRPEEAVATLQAGLARRSNDPRLLFALGNAHQQLGQLPEAIAAFRGALKADRNYLPAQYNLGAVLFEAERFEEAQEAYQAALASFDKALAKGQPVDPVHSQAYLNLGAIFLRKQAWRPALDAYRKAARLTPESPVAQYHVGYTLYQLGDREAAYTTYQEALRLDPDLPVARLHVARIEADRGRPAVVVEQLRDTVDRLTGSRQENALRLLAEAHLAVGDAAASEAAYRRLFQARPGDATVAVALSRLLRSQGRGGEARGLLSGSLEAALTAGPHGIAAGLELAALARETGDLTAEKDLYLKVLGSQGPRPELVSVRLNLALVLLQLGDRDAARERLESLLPELRSARNRTHRATEEAALRTVYALLLAAEGDLEEAEKQIRSVLRQANQETSQAAPARTALAALEAFSGKAENAVDIFQQQQESDRGRDSRLLRANLGQALWLVGRREEARPHLESAVAAYPRWLGPRVALGEIALATEELEPAREHLEAAALLCAEPNTALNPLAGLAGRTGAPGDGDNTRVFQLLVDGPRAPDALCERATRLLATTAAQESYRALAAGSAGRARSLAAQALEAPLDPKQQALAHFVRGSALLVLGRLEAARQDLTTALNGDLAPSLRAIAHNNVGVALQRQGRPDDARSQFEAARAETGSPTSTLLNLGIAAEARGEGAEALGFYERYLAAAPRSRRQNEVRQWVEELRRIYGEGP